jgi:hypothetical protein
MRRSLIQALGSVPGTAILSVIAFLVVFEIRVGFSNPATGAGFLFVVPIAMLAIRFGGARRHSREWGRVPSHPCI